MKKNISTSFIKLIGASGQQGDIHDRIIIIPEVQRDFAFGRTDKKSTEKRIGFIDSIFEALESSNKELPMTFVYGALDDDRFSPIDGQQRLSILFLLHWYFCPKDKIGIFKKGDQSRFVYEVRQFAKDFCRKIVDHSAEEIFAKEGVVKNFLIERIDASSLPEEKKEDQKKNLKIKLSDIIKNENWFIDSWTSDPTVSGMLVFLDAIHEKAIKNSTNRDDVWQKLISSNPPIYFDILVLDELTKPNELYVKMNSRGRELSEFDNFKSMMEGELQAMNPDKFDGIREHENNKADFIKNWTADIDNVWINVFWRYFVDKDKINEAEMIDMKNMKDTKFLKGIVGNVEDYYLKFFSLIIQFYIITRDDQAFNLNYTEITEESINDLSSLKRYAGKNYILNLVYQLKRAGFFTFDFFKYFRNCADALFYKNSSEDHEGTDMCQKTKNKDSLLKKILESKSPTYVDRVMFFGLLCFLRMKSNASQVFITSDEFWEWERVVYNLCNNSRIDDYNPYQNALIGLERLCREVCDPSQPKDILSFLDQKTDTSDLYGFSERSIKEEIKKAKLIKQDENAWKQRIKDAENNPLFDGYISALFECKEIDVSEDQSKFDDRLNHATMFFIEGDKTQFVEVLSYLISNMDSGQANACLREQKQKQVFYPSSSVLNTILTDDDWYPIVHILLDTGNCSNLGKGSSERWHRLLSNKKLLEYVINHDRALSFYVNGDFLYPKRSSSFYIALETQRRDNILTGLLNEKAISLKDGYEKIDLNKSSSLFIGPINIEFVYKNCTFRWKLEENKLAKLDDSENEIEIYEIQLRDDSNTIKQQMDNMLAAPATTTSPTTALSGTF